MLPLALLPLVLLPFRSRSTSFRSNSMVTGFPPSASSGTCRVVPAGGCSLSTSFTMAVVYGSFVPRMRSAEPSDAARAGLAE